MDIAQAKTADLIAYGFNNRIHSQEQVDRIANSINEFGFNQPIVVDEQNIVLVGHGRLEAAKKLGLEDVPVLKKIGLSETQKKAYRILDNKLQNDSTWDFANLDLELQALTEASFDLSTYGLDVLLGTALSDATQRPNEFQEFDDAIKTENKCPKCGYSWSGKSKDAQNNGSNDANPDTSND